MLRLRVFALALLALALALCPLHAVAFLRGAPAGLGDGPCNSSSSNFIACKMCLGAKSMLPKMHKQQQQQLNTTVTEAFSNIYSKQLWGGDKVGGGSGGGSIEACAVTAREVLRQLVFKYSLTSLLDAPCGGVYNSWMRHTISKLKSDLSCFQYMGIDAVASVVQRNSEFFAREDFVHFETADLSSAATKLPRGFDLILSRDALQHLNYKNIAGAWRSYCTSAARFILVGSYLHPGSNKLISTGETFPINLLLPPFSLPRPLEIFTENVCYTDTPMPIANPVKSLLLYRLREVCESDSLKSFLVAH